MLTLWGCGIINTPGNDQDVNKLLLWSCRYQSCHPRYYKLHEIIQKTRTPATAGECRFKSCSRDIIRYNIGQLAIMNNQQEVTYADLQVGDIIVQDNQEFVFLGANFGTMVGINEGKLEYFPADFIRPSVQDTEFVVRAQKVGS